MDLDKIIELYFTYPEIIEKKRLKLVNALNESQNYLSNINWKLTSTLVASPFMGEIICNYILNPAVLNGAESKALEVSLESILMFGIGVYISNNNLRIKREDAEIEILSISNRNLAEIVRTSEDVIIGFTPEGIINYWNNSGQLFYGYSSEEVLGKDFLFLVPEDKMDVIKSNFNKLRNGEKVPRYETKRFKKSGKLVDVSVQLSPVYNSDGILLSVSAIVRDITERKIQEEELKKYAMFDSLTGLYNRRMGYEYIHTQIEQANRSKKPLTFGFLDLNDFKEINDIYGHNEGDEALKYVANILKNSLRQSDGVIRQGGDEFILVMPNLDNIFKIEELEQKISAKLADYKNLLGASLPLSISFGFYTREVNSTESLDQILSNADRLMYQHKQARKE